MGVPDWTWSRTELCQSETERSEDRPSQVFSPIISVIMKSILLLSISLVVISAQDRTGFYRHNSAGDTGQPYVHDTTGDFGPYYYWKLRQQAKEQERSSGAVQPVETERKVVSVRKQVKTPQQHKPRFANFQPAPTAPRAPAAPRAPTAPAAPVRQAVQRQRVIQPQQPAAVPAFNADPRFAGLRFQFQINAPEFNYKNNFAENSYAFTSPLYATTAQGGSYSYSATY